ncbi:hypothetical protein PGTUg99_033203 [Puccinia graminis f. sp. tritici]|uniref:Uncharacterized protein n=1 Tax=Puccinia graminis f. sp. tritici TaxID=56615 RepID=A0A5B0S7W2_PUCGR|nr:hypothetical protein PGTUg99_033203 [Puccinia graminis f. sp. tritici]
MAFHHSFDIRRTSSPSESNSFPLPSLIECSLFGSTSHRSHTLWLTLSIETASWKRLIRIDRIAWFSD